MESILKKKKKNTQTNNKTKNPLYTKKQIQAVHYYFIKELSLELGNLSLCLK